MATLLTLLWLDALCTWREALASPSLTPTLILRMDEVTHTQHPPLTPHRESKTHTEAPLGAVLCGGSCGSW